MKNTKIMGLLSLTVATCLLLSGCVGLGDIVFGLGDMLGGGTSQSASLPQTQASSSTAGESTAPSSAPIASSSEASQPVEAPTEEESAATLALNKEVTSFIGKTNGHVRAVNGDVCAAYIMYGGSPVADYGNQSVAYPFAFWLDAEQADMMDVWMEYSDGEGRAPDKNFWPDSFPVGIIEAWGDSIPMLFGTDAPVSYNMLEDAYGQAPELEFTPANGGVDYTFSINTWAAMYQIEGFTMYAVFEELNGEQVLFLVRLHR